MLKFDRELTQCAVPRCHHYISAKNAVCEDCARKFSLDRETGYMADGEKTLHFARREIILKILSVDSGEIREIEVSSLFVAEKLINQRYIPGCGWDEFAELEKDEIVLDVEERNTYSTKIKGRERHV